MSLTLLDETFSDGVFHGMLGIGAMLGYLVWLLHVTESEVTSLSCVNSVDVAAVCVD